MRNSKKLSEKDINYALQEGLITQKEARQMFMAYFKKSDFSPLINMDGTKGSLRKS